MKSLNKLMRERLFFEWKLSSVPNGDTLLTELHGISSEVELIAKACGKVIEPILFKYNSTGEGFFTEDVIVNTQSYFAKQIFIRISIQPAESEKAQSKGEASYIPSKSIYNEKENKFDFVYVQLQLLSGEKGVCLAYVLPTIAHELTHAFEDWNRRKTGAEDMTISAKKRGYFNTVQNINFSRTTIERTFYMLMYFTDKAERNAFITAIISEIKPHLANCNTSEKAYTTLTEKSRTYNAIMSYDDVIKELNNISDSRLKNVFMRYWNNITGEQITDYNVFLKRLTKRWNLFKKKLVSSLGKQIADAAFENPNWFYLKPFSTDDFKKNEVY